MCYGEIIAALVAATATASSANQEKQQAKGQAYQAEQRASKTAAQAQEAQTEADNRANQRGPDTASLVAANSGGKGMSGGTMLTGPTGADPSALQLGKTTLLGS